MKPINVKVALPDTGRTVLGFFINNYSGTPAWGFEMVSYDHEAHRWLEGWTGEDRTPIIEYWADIEYPEEPAS